jgi:hypothetical protein
MHTSAKGQGSIPNGIIRLTFDRMKHEISWYAHIDRKQCRHVQSFTSPHRGGCQFNGTSESSHGGRRRSLVEPLTLNSQCSVNSPACFKVRRLVAF